jgi:hypothetical protein
VSGTLDRFAASTRTVSVVFSLFALIAINARASGADAHKPIGTISSGRRLTYGPRIGFSEGLGRISVNGKWGFINQRGEVVIAPRFDNLWSFSEGMAPAEVGHKWGFINTAGEMVIPPVIDIQSEFSEGVVCLQTGRGWQYFDTAGKVAIPATFESAGAFSEGWAPVVIEGKQHYIDHRGEIVLKPKVDRSEAFHEGLAVCWDGPQRTFGFLDRKGTQVVPTRFPRQVKWSPLGFQEGRALVPNDHRKWGFIDSKGIIVIPAEYDYASNFSEGLARVSTRNGCGFIDRQGTYVIEPRLEHAGDFSDGLASAKTEKEAGYIDHTGKLQIHLSREDTLWDFEGGFAIVMLPDLKWGYIDKAGKWIWNPTK